VFFSVSAASTLISMNSLFFGNLVFWNFEKPSVGYYSQNGSMHLNSYDWSVYIHADGVLEFIHLYTGTRLCMISSKYSEWLVAQGRVVLARHI
jgi:hypothetical protein